MAAACHAIICEGASVDEAMCHSRRCVEQRSACHDGRVRWNRTCPINRLASRTAWTYERCRDDDVPSIWAINEDGLRGTGQVTQSGNTGAASTLSEFSQGAFDNDELVGFGDPSLAGNTLWEPQLRLV